MCGLDELLFTAMHVDGGAGKGRQMRLELLPTPSCFTGGEDGVKERKRSDSNSAVLLQPSSSCKASPPFLHRCLQPSPSTPIFDTIGLEFRMGRAGTGFEFVPFTADACAVETSGRWVHARPQAVPCCHEMPRVTELCSVCYRRIPEELVTRAHNDPEWIAANSVQTGEEIESEEDGDMDLSDDSSSRQCARLFALVLLCLTRRCSLADDGDSSGSDTEGDKEDAESEEDEDDVQEIEEDEEDGEGIYRVTSCRSRRRSFSYLISRVDAVDAEEQEEDDDEAEDAPPQRQQQQRGRSGRVQEPPPPPPSSSRASHRSSAPAADPSYSQGAVGGGRSSRRRAALLGLVEASEGAGRSDEGNASVRFSQRVAGFCFFFFLHLTRCLPLYQSSSDQEEQQVVPQSRSTRRRASSPPPQPPPPPTKALPPRASRESARAPPPPPEPPVPAKKVAEDAGAKRPRRR